MINNVVVCTDLQCDIDLRQLTLRCSSIIYNPKTFPSVQWKHPKIGGHCMVFRNGKMIVNGKVKSVKEAKRRLRQYARLLQVFGWTFQLRRINVKTISASYKVEGPVDLTHIVRYYRGSYEPERFPAAMFQKDCIHFTCFHSGTVLMTGIKDENQLRTICMSVLIELPLL